MTDISRNLEKVSPEQLEQQRRARVDALEDRIRQARSPDDDSPGQVVVDTTNLPKPEPPPECTPAMSSTERGTVLRTESGVEKSEVKNFDPEGKIKLSMGWHPGGVESGY